MYHDRGLGRRLWEAPPDEDRLGAPQVSVVELSPQKLELTTELPGRTVAYRVAAIRPQVNELILKRAFDEGADVRRGELLYQIDSAPYEAALDQAKAALAVAEANVPAQSARADRLAKLVEINAVGQQSLYAAEQGRVATERAVRVNRITLFKVLGGGTGVEGKENEAESS